MCYNVINRYTVYLLYFYGDVMEDLNLRSCCFFGHRKIEKTPELIERLTKEIEVLITEKDVNVFFLAEKVTLMIYAIKLLAN